MIRQLKGVVARRRQERRAELYRSLIRREAKIGGTLFGKVPANGRREFFCLDPYTWVWHEEWQDNNGVHQIKNVRYSIRPDVILKTLDGQQYQAVSNKEAFTLYQAAKAYRQKVNQELYTFTA